MNHKLLFSAVCTRQLATSGAALAQNSHLAQTQDQANPPLIGQATTQCGLSDLHRSSRSPLLPLVPAGWETFGTNHAHR